jgi:hypothetical protein
MRIEKDWQIVEGVGQNMSVNVESIRLKKVTSFLLDREEDGLAERQARTSGEWHKKETWPDAKFLGSAGRKEQKSVFREVILATTVTIACQGVRRRRSENLATKLGLPYP